MFRLDSDGVYRSSLLDELTWVTHGFGTKASDGWPGEYVRVKQIHSNLVVEPGAEEGDALTTATPGTVVGVRTADCVPILLAAADVRAVAAVHAGWRGTSDEITRHTVEKLTARYGTNPRAIHAAIGPAIGDCCYEVGTEVLNRFGVTSGTCVDLVAINKQQLEEAGVVRIDVLGICTKCDSQLHSFRRDKEHSGRMVAAIGHK